MPNILETIHARRYLEEINQYILHNEGEVMEVPGKLSLVWSDPLLSIRRYLSIKAAGASEVLINGRRYPATETGIKQGLVACLKDMQG
jgi:hypothetical protein